MKLTTQEKKAAIETSHRILSDYSQEKGKLIPLLQHIQNELGYVPSPAMEVVAGHFGVSKVDVYGIVTFYNQFRLTPPGKNEVKVCMGTACHMRGGNIIMDSWKRRLEIDCGETSEDREFSLDRVACVGCCTQAPVTLINDEIHPKVTPTRVDGLLYAYQLNKDKESEKAGEEN